MSLRISFMLLIAGLCWWGFAAVWPEGGHAPSSRSLSVAEGRITAATQLTEPGVVVEVQPGADSAHRKGEPIVADQPPGLAVADSRVVLAVAPQATMAARQGHVPEPETPPEWNAAFQHSDTAVRIQALERWAEQGAATPLNPLSQALVDPDELVRTRAQELVERVWAAKAQAGAR